MAHPPARVAIVPILLLWTRLAAGGPPDHACVATCFGASCDYWDGGAWGTCTEDPCLGDLTGDGVVDGADLGELFRQWGDTAD